jgi:predicted Na+-dependent transporter
MLFPVWALISGCTAFFHPASLNWMTTQQFEWGVGLLMLAMGLSLTKEDFQKVRLPVIECNGGMVQPQVIQRRAAPLAALPCCSAQPTLFPSW